MSGVSNPGGSGSSSSSPVATTVAAAGASQALAAPALGDAWYDLTLSAAACTLSLSGGTSGKASTIYMRLRQDATGGRTVTFPGTVTWPGSITPTLQSLPSAYDVFALTTTNAGTSWTGAILGPDSGTFTQVAADTLYRNSSPGPSDMGSLKGLSADPRLTNSNRAMVAGVLYCAKVKGIPGASVTTLKWYVATASSGTGTLANIFWGVFDQTGAQLSVSTNQAAAGMIAGDKSLTVPTFTIPADGTVIVAHLVGTLQSVPYAFTSGPGIGSGVGINWGLDGTTGYPWFAYGSALTAMPATLTLNSTNCVFTAPGQSICLLGLA